MPELDWGRHACIMTRTLPCALHGRPVSDAVQAAWHRSGRQPDAARTQYDAHLYALHLGAAEAVTPAMLLDAALAPLRCAHPPLCALCARLGGTRCTSMLGQARWFTDLQIGTHCLLPQLFPANLLPIQFQAGIGKCCVQCGRATHAHTACAVGRLSCCMFGPAPPASSIALVHRQDAGGPCGGVPAAQRAAQGHRGKLCAEAGAAWLAGRAVRARQRRRGRPQRSDRQGINDAPGLAVYTATGPAARGTLPAGRRQLCALALLHVWLHLCRAQRSGMEPAHRLGHGGATCI